VSIATSGVAGTVCAVLSDGTVRCWGDNYFGEVGNGTSGSASERVVTPSAVPNLTGVTAVAVGYGNTCAIGTGGVLSCWGDNQSGELGNGTTNNAPAPTMVSGLTGATGVSVGGGPNGFYSCATVPGGLLYCWGSNGASELGLGYEGDLLESPTQTRISNVLSVAAGEYSACAIVSGGTVECWGEDGLGQLGNGTVGGSDQSTPTAVPNLTGVTSISAGQFHFCALLTGGTVKCWGNDLNGQVGDGLTGGQTPTPTVVSGLTAVPTAVSAGENHTCALLTDGTVECWGDNSSGELGNGLVNSSSGNTTPVKVATLKNVTQVAAGANFTCALLATGEVDCWGDNSVGELGNGTTSVNPQPTPAPVVW